MKKDLFLWHTYSKTIVKLKQKNEKISIHPSTESAQSIVFIEKNEISKCDILPSVINVAKQLSISNFSKKEKRNFRSDISLDLHGYTANNVPHALNKFCISCAKQNKKNITIISGKGSGIVRNAVLSWLQHNPIFVLKYSTIKDAQNEVGHFIIHLRCKTIIQNISS